MDRTQNGATPDTNADAILVVDDHLETLRADAAARRSFRVERPSLFQRIAASVASMKAFISTPVEMASTARWDPATSLPQAEPPPSAR